jgi:23S rRNA-/tRNA-specific pseudouridylate synthase
MILPLPESPFSEIRVLAAGRGWLAIDKPSGVSVHNDPEGRTDALHLAARLLETDAELRAQTGWVPNTLPSPAHRLDRETSGILLLAVNSNTASILQTAFQQNALLADTSSVRASAARTTKKTYVAVLRGHVSKDAKKKWSWPLSDRAEGRDRPQGPSRLQKPAVTAFEIERTNRHLTRVACELHTGRQHQIRRHACLAGHAIVGDKRYCDSRFNRKIEELYGIQRMLLHATSLELELGGAIGSIRIHSPPPPEFDLIFQEQVP